MAAAKSDREKLAEKGKIADMMCSAHANLRDRYSRRALRLDILLLVSSAFVAAHTFGTESIRATISPLGISYDLWLGIFGLLVFSASIVQFRVSWKEKAGAHARSFSVYSEVKHDIGRLLAAKTPDPSRMEEVLARYALAAEAGAAIPEAEFLKQKQKHKLKVFVSKHLDANPGASVSLVKLKAFLRDNFGWDGFTK